MPITQTIDALVDVPTTADPENFATRADSLFGTQLPTRITQMNTFAAQANTLAAAMNAVATGGAVSIQYTFSTTTADADPGDGKLRLNQATQNTATVIRADLLDYNGGDFTTLLSTLDDSTSTIKGFVTLRSLTDERKWLTFALTALASPSGYRNLTVTCIASSEASPFADGELVAFDWTRTGDKGDAAGDAAGVTFAPAGNLSATNVQAAIEELDSEKQPASANLTEYAAVNPTAAGLALLDDADADAQLATLGLSANGRSLAKAADYTAMLELLEPGQLTQIGSDVSASGASVEFTGLPATYKHLLIVGRNITCGAYPEIMINFGIFGTWNSQPLTVYHVRDNSGEGVDVFVELDFDGVQYNIIKASGGVELSDATILRYAQSWYNIFNSGPDIQMLAGNNFTGGTFKLYRRY